MGTPKRRRSPRAGRLPMRSPGRPTAGRREHRRRFWEAIACGLSSEEAALGAGVSQPVGTRWFRESGGMPPISLAPLSGRYLSFAEREEIAILHAQHCGVRDIARRISRSPSTIFRELRRNAATCRSRMRPVRRPPRNPTAMTTMLLVFVCRPRTPVSSPPTYASSTSTSPASRSRSGRTIARRNLCNQDHAV